ncbi:hypothetical protein C6A85_98175 [Mycobacterium sp. ITM-2017-0098]|nr:hypothetical protein C6A85_98175 [Mycobacterium sp. ITM-2017-0098]
MHTYVDGEAFRRTAYCDCGWKSVKRWSRGSADVDAAIHVARAGHLQPEIPVKSPLVLQAFLTAARSAR